MYPVYSFLARVGVCVGKCLPDAVIRRAPKKTLRRRSSQRSFCTLSPISEHPMWREIQTLNEHNIFNKISVYFGPYFGNPIRPLVRFLLRFDGLARCSMITNVMAAPLMALMLLLLLLLATSYSLLIVGGLVAGVFLSLTVVLLHGSIFSNIFMLCLLIRMVVIYKFSEWEYRKVERPGNECEPTSTEIV